MGVPRRMELLRLRGGVGGGADASPCLPYQSVHPRNALRALTMSDVGLDARRPALLTEPDDSLSIRGACLLFSPLQHRLTHRTAFTGHCISTRTLHANR